MFERDLYRTLARNLPGFGILLFDHSLRYIMALGDDILATSGTSEKELIGRALDETSFPASSEVLEKHYVAALAGEVGDVEVRREGRAYAIRTAPIRSAVGQIVAGMVTYHDVTEMVRARDALQAISVTDELTGIYNRRGFMLLAGQQMKVANRSESGALLYFADLNDLKVINDGIGHEAGDDALRSAASVLSSTFRESDIVARYGGDEFVVFVTDVKSDMDVTFRKRLKNKLAEVNSRGRRFKLSLSMGLSVFVPNVKKDLESMITEADKDMYSKKKVLKASFGSSGQLPAVRQKVAAGGRGV